MDLNPKDAELIVGIVARIGVDTKQIVRAITEQLKEYKYEAYDIHVTEVLGAFSSHLTLTKSPPEEKYGSYITACNTLRADTDNAVMAMIAIMEIVSKRTASDGSKDLQRRRAFIVNQIKRPEEFLLLR